MGRYKPPQKPGSAYITGEGYERLQAELKALWTTRHEVTAALSAAAAEGDRSENAEYIYRKKQLREIDRRIRYLQKRLPDLTVVRDKPTDATRVYFGAWVRLEDEQGTEVVYRVVGPDEFDPATNAISMDSPVGRALMRKALDDEVTVSLPAGDVRYVVTEISYSSIALS